MKHILFNFKAYLDVEGSIRLASEFTGIETRNEVIIAPPPLAIYSIAKAVEGKKISICAQNFDYSESYGAHTGDVLIDDIKRLGCKYAMIGHSEVRHRNVPRQGESDELISKKVALCVDRGVIPVLCFGETIEEKNGGRTDEIITKQLKSALSGISGGRKKAILAYEPVWAISSSKGAESCDVNYVERVAGIVRMIAADMVDYNLLYGGSVDAANISDYLSSGMIDGVLIGRAGTDPRSLAALAKGL